MHVAFYLCVASAFPPFFCSVLYVFFLHVYGHLFAINYLFIIIIVIELRFYRLIGILVECIVLILPLNDYIFCSETFFLTLTT